MRRWLLPGAFLAAAVFSGAHMVSALLAAPGGQGARTALVGVYYLLRTAIALAFAVFTIGRPSPREHARQPLAIAACVAAMAAVLAFAPPQRTSDLALVLAGDAIAVIACVWLLTSVLALGRCFGVLPEARGLVTRGPYRLVRHPVYLGELGACVGLAIAVPSPANTAVLCLFAAAQAARMSFEERALTAAFPDYAAYAARTPRLLPGAGLPGRAYRRRQAAAGRAGAAQSTAS
jgi:protein-S-isoprenylcysteine O-methyltransferase Ste14